MGNILVHNEKNDAKFYEYQGNFDIHKLHEAIQVFMLEFDKNEKVIITSSLNKKTNRKITWDEAKEFYNNYPFRKLTGESDDSYHRMKLTSIQWEILTHFTVKTEDKFYSDILNKI